MIDISWINEQIAVGRAFPNTDIPSIKNIGIDAIVDVRSECCDNKEVIEKFGLQFLHVEIEDSYIPTFKQLEKIFNFVEPLLNKGKKIFVHCQNGYGRSPLVVVAILAKRGKTIPDAVNIIEGKHPRTTFSHHQQNFIYTQLKEFLESKSS
jgi:dual specificity MAP kinase phosphatase